MQVVRAGELGQRIAATWPLQGLLFISKLSYMVQVWPLMVTFAHTVGAAACVWSEVHLAGAVKCRVPPCCVKSYVQW